MGSVAFGAASLVGRLGAVDVLGARAARARVGCSRKERVRAFAPLAASLATAVAATACAPRPAARIEAGMATMEREQKADKLLARGRAFAEVGDLTRAEQYLAAALDAGAPADATLPLLIHVCTEAQRFRVAITYAENQLRTHPGDLKLRFLVGTLYAGIRDGAAAKAAFEAVIAGDPTHADAQFALASVLRETLADPVGADEHYREYLRLAPRGPHADEARASLLKSLP